MVHLRVTCGTFEETPDLLYGFHMVGCSCEGFVGFLHVDVHSDLFVFLLVITTFKIQGLCVSWSTSSILFSCQILAECSLRFARYIRGTGQYGAVTDGTEWSISVWQNWWYHMTCHVNSKQPNCIQSSKFEFCFWIRTHTGPLLPGTGFQIRSPRYHHFYLTDMELDLISLKKVYALKAVLVNFKQLVDAVLSCCYDRVLFGCVDV